MNLESSTSSTLILSSSTHSTGECYSRVLVSSTLSFAGITYYWWFSSPSPQTFQCERLGVYPSGSISFRA